MPSGIYIRTDDMRKNMSIAHIGKTSWNKGKKLSSEHIKKLKLAKLGKPRSGKPENWKHTEETKIKNSKAHLGLPAWNKGLSGYKTKPCSEERRLKISKSRKGQPNLYLCGEKNHNWKGGITPINMKIRNSSEYKDWRIKVFQRDNYTCQECGNRGITLHADHIKPFAYYPELRLVIENGRTLCVPCHKLTDTYLWKLAPQNKNKKICLQ